MFVVDVIVDDPASDMLGLETPDKLKSIANTRVLVALFDYLTCWERAIIGRKRSMGCIAYNHAVMKCVEMIKGVSFYTDISMEEPYTALKPYLHNLEDFYINDPTTEMFYNTLHRMMDIKLSEPVNILSYFGDILVNDNEERTKLLDAFRIYFRFLYSSRRSLTDYEDYLMHAQYIASMSNNNIEFDPENNFLLILDKHKDRPDPISTIPLVSLLQLPDFYGKCDIFFSLVNDFSE